MDFFKNAEKRVSKAIDIFLEKNKKRIESNKIKFIIKSHANSVKEYYEQIGKYYYNNIRDTKNTQLEELCNKIDISEKIIDDYRKKLIRLNKDNYDDIEPELSIESNKIIEKIQKSDQKKEESNHTSIKQKEDVNIKQVLEDIDNTIKKTEKKRVNNSKTTKRTPRSNNKKTKNSKDENNDLHKDTLEEPEKQNNHNPDFIDRDDLSLF